jgi:hypothetical protein
MSDKKKNKKSSKDFADSILNDLTGTADGTLFGSPVNSDKDKEKISELLLEATATSTAHDRELPEGLESKEAIFQVKDSKESNATPSEAKSAIGEKTAIVAEQNYPSSEASTPQASDSEIDISDRTVVVGSSRVHGSEPVEEKVSFGVARPSTKSLHSPTASAIDSQLQQAENLRMAQERLTQLEKELEKLRAENEQLSSTNEVAKEKTDELAKKLDEIEREKSGLADQYRSEIEIYRDGANSKDTEILKLRQKVDELENRLRQDLRKIRVRERELENRLELAKMEKDALIKAKDESILELKRKLDQVTHELDNYRHRVSDLNNKIENNHEQLSRTVRALRLALTNLEVSDSSGSLTVTPLRKAE